MDALFSGFDHLSGQKHRLKKVFLMFLFSVPVTENSSLFSYLCHQTSGHPSLKKIPLVSFRLSYSFILFTLKYVNVM